MRVAVVSATLGTIVCADALTTIVCATAGALGTIVWAAIEGQRDAKIAPAHEKQIVRGAGIEGAAAPHGLLRSLDAESDGVLSGVERLGLAAGTQLPNLAKEKAIGGSTGPEHWTPDPSRDPGVRPVLTTGLSPML